MTRNRSFPVLALAAGIWACGGGESARTEDEATRDLSLAPAESIATLSDRPAAQPPRPPQTATRTPPPPPARSTPPTVAAGTGIELWAADTLTSRHNRIGDQVMATAGSPVKDARGRDVIPAGAVFLGTITDVAPAESPGGQGRLALSFNRVQFGGKTYAVEARVDTLGTYMKGRGVTAGDAAKVGVGAVVGAVAGRIIGGNKTGTAVGAAAGAAAGVGIAAATRDVDIIMPAGAQIRLVLTAPFVLEEVDE